MTKSISQYSNHNCKLYYEKLTNKNSQSTGQHNDIMPQEHTHIIYFKDIVTSHSCINNEKLKEFNISSIELKSGFISHICFNFNTYHDFNLFKTIKLYHYDDIIYEPKISTIKKLQELIDKINSYIENNF